MTHQLSHRLRRRRKHGEPCRLEVVYRPIAELKPDLSNPRLHSKQQIRQIAHSIGAFGFNVPVLIDADSHIITGHGRVRAAQGLGLREAPTICLEHLTDVQARAFLIADNRLTENSSWDETLLAQQLKALAAVDLDFDLDVTGFETPEIDLMIEGLTPTSPGEADPADTIPDVGSDPSVSRVGDR